MDNERENPSVLVGHAPPSFSAQPSEDRTRCEIIISTDYGFAKVRLNREETFRLGQTLLLMTGSMHDDRS